MELALHVFSSRLSLSLLFSSILNPFSSEARRVTEEFFPCDSFLSWTNHPTTVVRFQDLDWKCSARNFPSLSAARVWATSSALPANAKLIEWTEVMQISETA
ncbi:hypothetical protein AVEN_190724-1 [Araneus ventricosus]|uniref:Secreted protein n=1 Tax=Araneus ventricosus TaxID=182803 RepID=A0A4Y2KVC2_ARAVE|nr:hypothetical protein AVEN_190724-1 [Araneus ventricosus]